MRLLILSVVGCLLSPFIVAQTRVPAAKYARANQILQQVGATYGFDALELPKLVIYPKQTSRRIAYLEGAPLAGKRTANTLDRSRLVMDEDLFDACMAIDRQSGAALAFVLSHEMAHFYLKHATYRSFAERKGVTMSETESRRQESEADQTGLLFAYLAGYDPEPVLNALFDTLYAQYNLIDPLPGHPAKPDRQKAATLRAAEFRTYGYLFAVGHALYCREKFTEAARCFEYVYTRYPLKEAYNNFGVCRLQEITRQKKKTSSDYFALPFEVDPRNRLLRMGERSGADNTTDVITLISEANTAFGRALAMDPRYPRTYLNQAIGYLLADNAFLALGTLEQLKRQTGALFPPNGYLLRGIAYCALNEFPKAEQNLQLALAHRAYQADYNVRLFQAIKTGTITSLRQPWQRLQAQKNLFTPLGCQATQLPLQEVDQVPATLRSTTLIEQNTPPPFIVVTYGQDKGQTYFQVKLRTADARTQQRDLFFARKSGAVKAGP